MRLLTPSLTEFRVKFGCLKKVPLALVFGGCQLGYTNVSSTYTDAQISVETSRSETKENFLFRRKKLPSASDPFTVIPKNI